MIAASGADNGQQGLLNRHRVHKLTKAHEGGHFTICVRRKLEHELREDDREMFTFSDDTEMTLQSRT
jgi:hypothetical protein